MKRTLAQVRAHPVFKALDPTGKALFQAHFLPDALNPFAVAGIRLAALVPLGLPHIKVIPTMQMMLDDFKAGRYDGVHTIVVPSSGNTAHAVARLAPAFGPTKVKAVMSNDVPHSKTGILKAFGDPVDVLQVSDVLATTQELARKRGHYHLDQYSHPGNPLGHKLHTGPAILRLLARKQPISAIAVAMGSGGTVAGVGSFFKHAHPQTAIIGVRPKVGEQVPGARDREKMEEVVRIPWKKVVRSVEEVTRKESFIRTRQLWSAVEPQPGPTSGLAWGGLERYLEKLGKKELAKLRGTCAAFMCPDDGRFYSELMMAELDPDQGIV